MARFWKSPFPERAILEKNLPVRAAEFPERAVLEKGIFQNGPFCKIRFYRTARSGKDLPHQSSRISRTARSGKDDFIERAVLENLIL